MKKFIISLVACVMEGTLLAIAANLTMFDSVKNDSPVMFILSEIMYIGGMLVIAYRGAQAMRMKEKLNERKESDNEE